MLKFFSVLIFFITVHCNSIDINVYNFDKNKVNILLVQKENNKVKLGLEFLLDTDWKIYWKFPGDVGLGPSLQITEGSKKHKININWPFPKELYEEDVNLTSRVYYNHVILPTEILFFDLSNFKKNRIKFILDFQICKEICIPVSTAFYIDLPKEDFLNSNYIEKIKLYETKIPKDIKFSKNLTDDKIIINSEGLIVELNKVNKKNLLKSSNNDHILLENNSIGTTRFIKVEEDKKKLYFFLKGENIDNIILNKSKVFMKVNDEYYSWNTEDHLLQTNSLHINIILLLSIAFLGGFILNFMPCVLPVLGLKINSFMQELQSRDSVKIKLSSISIALGIISTFLIFAILASTLRYFGKSVGWGMQFQSPAFIIFLIIILIFFILNLLGLYEIRLPKIFSLFSQNKKKDNKSNIYIKNYFTGIISTLLATPCTAPFVGTAVSIALTQNFLYSILIFSFMAIGKSMPYLIFVIYPKIIYYFPKPGKWFAYLKYFFALLLTLTVIWLINIILNTQQEVSEDWEEFEKFKINQYLDDNQSVFVDVTAEWCLSCAVNKKLVLDQKDIKELFKSKGIKTLRADWTNRDNDILAFLNEYNKYGIPFNILYTPSMRNGLIFSEILTKNQIKKAIEQHIDIK